jgi:hypothetical protein
MAWHLAPGVTAATVGADLVFLDVVQDAYLCLPAGAAAVQRLTYGWVIEDPALAEDLMTAGLICERPGAGRSGPPAPTPATDLVDQPRPKPSLAECLAFGATAAAMRGRYHGKTLQQMITRAARRGEGESRRAGRPPSPSLTRRAGLFDVLLPWAPGQEACLYRSFMLLHYLGDLGRDASWVFGVRTRPFEAHCWIQAGPVVLNDSAEHVLGYTQILVT